MSELKNIVITVKHKGTHAVDWAAKGFLNNDQIKNVTLLSVSEAPIQEGYISDSSIGFYDTEAMDAIADKCFEGLKQYVSTLAANLRKQFPKITINEHIVPRGDVRDEIVDFTEKSNADLLIVGSRNLGAFKRTFIGSTSDYCVHHCSCPVLVVKHRNE